MGLTLNQGSETAAAVLSIIYTIFLMREDIRCWIFGILASVISVYLMYDALLYGQSIIYSYYILMGFYGWYTWNRKGKTKVNIQSWSVAQHLVILSIGVIVSITVAWISKQFTNGAQPYADATLTVFGFIATYQQTQKIRSSWVYWFVINIASAWLYATQGMYIYAGLMLVYAGLCIPGYMKWKRISLK